MSPHGSARVPAPRPNLGHQPSFSAALLDAIYHSLEADADARSSPAQPQTPVSSRHRPTTTTPALSRSGSACSSVRSPRLQRPPRPCRVRPDPQPSSLLLPRPPQPHEPITGFRGPAEKKTRTCRKKNRKVAPFACLLNALLCNRNKSSAKSLPTTPTRAVATAPPATEPASARSILSSRASRRESAATGGGVLTPARRAVRFSPVAVVVDDEHGRGIGTATRLRDAEEELLRALGVAEERETAKESSESSSDLFDLESFPPAFEEAELPPRPRASSFDAGLERPRSRVYN